jgi:hypothetical protein
VLLRWGLQKGVATGDSHSSLSNAVDQLPSFRPHEYVWVHCAGCCVIPKSVHAEYIRQFSEQELLSWTLTVAEMAALDALEDGQKYCWDPTNVR